jgi:hypothetical protein
MPRLTMQIYEGKSKVQDVVKMHVHPSEAAVPTVKDSVKATG